MKQRIDANGNVIEARKEGIGAPKVSLNTDTFLQCSNYFLSVFWRTFFLISFYRQIAFEMFMIHV
jgi:hypothetical protein